MIKKHVYSILTLFTLFFMSSEIYAQQNVFSRSDVTTGNFGDGQLPWYYETSTISQGDPDSGSTTRNFVKIGHNNNTIMSTNGRFYLVNTLDFESAATSARTINNINGGLSVSGGIYNASIATHTINTPIGIDGPSVQIHSNSSGGFIIDQTIFINSNTVEFGNLGSGEIVVNGVMQGTGNMQKTGNNTLVTTASNTYSGTTTVITGTLKLQGNLLNSAITVKSGATLEINGSITVKSIIVEAGGYVRVNSGMTLTVSNELTLESNSMLYSSLISDGTISGIVKYNRHVNNNDSVNGNDLISAPLSGQAFNTFIANNPNITSNPTGPEVLFGRFDNDSNTSPYELWNDTDTTPLAAGKGYRSGIAEGALSNLVTFEGAVSTGLVQTYIDQGTESTLNLIGNPFPSYLDAQEFLSHNASLLDPSAVVIYGYNDSTDGSSAGDYTIISALLNTDINIAPGQGFFVASNSLGGNIEFTTTSTDMRLASGGDDFITGRSTSTAITNLKLNLNKTTDNFITDIFFTEYSSLDLDPGYDASLLGGVAPSFALYSHLVQENTGVPFAVQALGKTDYTDITIPLGVNANQGEQLTFSIIETNLPSSVDVYLEDNVDNTSTLLNTSNYVLTPSADLYGTGRFYLRVSNSTLSTLDSNLDELNIYTNKADNTIVIAGQLLEPTTASIYDVQGRLISTTLLQTNLRSQAIDASKLNNGIYVVKLHNAAQNKTQKVILR
ncbi:T9SS type A sorting domain-containing protein [Winogradskyella thalassocola]|uniref:Por secretion system C-terminal sorting domain-containing protein n=1 Tax=Winogradskyella thalassocola TaxID=262004 RepID=A0A1G7YZ86_9FLAO|nr:T9SS type A sorting domain-containing protein [Winogradskyella thalassocola]SDH01737.1 Por secretion system C-terminal sorting domain-containing protein [Winogradskyella thalassocola]